MILQNQKKKKIYNFLGDLKMIERYSLSPMKEIWTLSSQYERWFEVELAVIKAYELKSICPAGTYDFIKNNTKIDVKKILEIEKEVDHDVIAFIKQVTENLGEYSRFFHYGLTSSDIVDTSWSLAIKRALEMIIIKMEEFYEVLRQKAFEYKNTVTIGRTHGVHAEPTTFGLKLLSYLSELERNIERIKRVKEEISVGKLSGAVGNYANIDPEIEEIALKELGLKRCKVSTQIIPRDIHANLLNSLALIGGMIERLAIEVRHLQKTEVLEAMEPFKKGQRGSSAMPHKKNPILCERLTGMARMLRSYAIGGMENIALWHERDISHSSVERVFLPDAFQITYYMLVKVIYLIENLVVFEDRMLKNFEKSFNLVFSQQVMLAIIDKGVTREEAYKNIQKLTLEAWEKKIDFKVLVKNSDFVKKYLNDEEIDKLFDYHYYTKNIDKIFKRFIKK